MPTVERISRSNPLPRNRSRSRSRSRDALHGANRASRLARSAGSTTDDLSRPKGAPAKKPVQKFTLLPESSRAGGASAKRLLPRATLLRPASDDDLDVAGAAAEPKSPRSSSRLSRSADTDSRSRSRSRSRSSPYAKERPAAAIFPTEVDELGIEILIPEYDRVTVAVAWHVSKATAAALAPRADALVAAMLAPTVQAYARVPEKRRVDFVSIPVTWTAAAAASDTPYHDTLRSYERGSAPSMLKLMRQAWKKVPFCFAGQHVHNCMIVITDGHEDVLREPCEEMAMLMRGRASDWRTFAGTLACRERPASSTPKSRGHSSRRTRA